jgi:ATP-dependent Clp protease ATP-binding subunit ClpA
MTTNAGARDMEATPMGFGALSQAGDNKASLERTFAPEFRNRLDGLITFTHLSPSIIEQVVDKLIIELETQLSAKRVTLELTAAAKTYLATHGYDRKNGARPMGRLIDQRIRRRLADEILFGALQQGGVVRVDAGGEDGLLLACEPLAARDTEAMA